jgi:YgiT-type zinc finger domain-containing protein
MICTKCSDGVPEIGITSLTYSRKGSAIQVRVEGIPAEICPVCGEVYLSQAVAQQIHDLISPLFNLDKEMSDEAVLPIPMVVIQFPPLEPEQIQRAIALV